MTKNIPNLKIDNFEYTPHINISQHTISHLNCLPCRSDGGTPGYIFAQPIKEIVKLEMTNALKEVMLPSTANPSCSLKAIIKHVSFNAGNGNLIIDSIFKVKSLDEVKFIKRIRAEYYSSLFEMSKLNRLLAKPSRKSIELLINDESFLDVVHQSCK